VRGTASPCFGALLAAALLPPFSAHLSEKPRVVTEFCVVAEGKELETNILSQDFENFRWLDQEMLSLDGVLQYSNHAIDSSIDSRVWRKFNLAISILHRLPSRKFLVSHNHKAATFVANGPK
jgi:hypothetical protein